MERAVCVIIGYVFGLIQTGYIYGRMNGVDIRKYGSGNAGTTNAMRTLGVKAGLITFFGDALKCVAAVLVCWGLFAWGPLAVKDPGILPLLGMYAGIGAVLGHNFPFYLRFRGGKGIAAMSGMILMTDWRLAALCFLVFVVIVAVTRYVSLASLVISVLFFAGVLIEGQMGWFAVSKEYLPEMYGIALLFVLSAFFKHRENIKRLRNGTENPIRFSRKGSLKPVKGQEETETAAEAKDQTAADGKAQTAADAKKPASGDGRRAQIPEKAWDKKKQDAQKEQSEQMAERMKQSLPWQKK